MIKQFKFFRNQGKSLFQTEITNNIRRTPNSNMSWSREYSDVIREWVSELYFTNTYTNPNLHLRYIHQIDRTCELMQTPSILRRTVNSSLFCANVKIWKSNDEWMIVELSYPTDHILYR
jgi:hypothetical protein